MFTLEQLRGFVTVAEELNFGRAALRLNMTQPPLTRQIQKLERSIGVVLFERDKRRVILTPGGEAFLGEARKLLTLAEAAPDLARRISKGTSGVLRLGFTATSTLGILGDLITAITSRLPGVHLDLHELVTREQLSALEQGEIDVGLARPPFDPEVFESRLVFKEPMVVAAPSDHPLAALGRPFTSQDLVHQDLVMHSPTQARYFYDLIVKMLPVSNARFVHTASQVLTIVSLVSAGRGLAIVPDSARRLGLQGVTYLDLAQEDRAEAQLHAVWLKESQNPALRRALMVIPAPA
jgi:DNA-binding transcriptional LysR family regulator